MPCLMYWTNYVLWYHQMNSSAISINETNAGVPLSPHHGAGVQLMHPVSQQILPLNEKAAQMHLMFIGVVLITFTVVMALKKAVWRRQSLVAPENRKVFGLFMKKPSSPPSTQSANGTSSYDETRHVTPSKWMPQSNLLNRDTFEMVMCWRWWWFWKKKFTIEGIDLMQLRSHLPRHLHCRRWSIVYSTVAHGFSLSRLLRLSHRQHGENVLIIKDMHGYVRSRLWCSYNDQQYDNEIVSDIWRLLQRTLEVFTGSFRWWHNVHIHNISTFFNLQMVSFNETKPSHLYKDDLFHNNVVSLCSLARTCKNNFFASAKHDFLAVGGG